MMTFIYFFNVLKYISGSQKNKRLRAYRDWMSIWTYLRMLYDFVFLWQMVMINSATYNQQLAQEKKKQMTSNKAQRQKNCSK